MADGGDLDYAQARLQARHGQTLMPSDWARLEGSRDLQHFLATAATTALVRWTRPLNAGMGTRELERSLRREWREYVATVASWLPEPWQQAIRWAGVLPELQCLARLADPDPCPAWMFADTVYGNLAPGPPAERAAAMQTTPYAPLSAAVAGLESITRAWYAHWQGVLPSMPGSTRLLLLGLEDIVGSRAVTEAATQGTQPQTLPATARIQRTFREAAGTPVSALAHLALQALMLEDLRGRVVTLTAFNPTGRGP